MTGKHAMEQSKVNCAKVVAYLREHGETGSSNIRKATGLSALNVTHLFNFNQILIDDKEDFRLSTRTATEGRKELLWSLREKGLKL